MKYLIKAKKENYTRFAVVIPTEAVEIDLVEFFSGVPHGRSPEQLLKEIQGDQNIILTAVGPVAEAVEPVKTEKPVKKAEKKEPKAQEA